uniref:Myosin_tail_1 domain-containing protein n=1 Tax=Macrostomum lignano TaxID=282301 RepID=A0A1I8FAS6_9PLAT
EVPERQSDLESTQRESRGYSAEIFKLKAQLEEARDQTEAVRRENKTGEGGRNVHEVDKARRRLEMEKEELQAALEEAESALEQPRTFHQRKFQHYTSPGGGQGSRTQLELAQVRQDIDRRIAEKEEEFESTRKNHQRAMDSMAATVDAEAKGKAEVQRQKKKLEQDINELEVALDSANRARADADKTVKNRKWKTSSASVTRPASRPCRLSASSTCSPPSLTSCAPSSNPRRERARKAAESERMEASDRIGELSASKRVSQRHQAQAGGRHQRYAGDLDEQHNEARNARSAPRRPPWTRSASPTRSASSRSTRCTPRRPAPDGENALKELQARLDAAEGGAAKGGKRELAKLESRVRDLEGELDAEQRRHQRDAEERQEVRAPTQGAVELVEKLQSKVKAYKRQVEEAEEIAATINLAKFRKVQHDLEESEERAEVAEQSLTKFRSKSRTSVSVTRGPAPPPPGGTFLHRMQFLYKPA